MDFPQYPEIPEQCLSCDIVCGRLDFGEKMKNDIQQLSERMDVADDTAIDVAVQVHDILSLPEDIYNGIREDLREVIDVIEANPGAQRLTLLEFLQEYRTGENSELGVLAFTPLIANMPDVTSMPLRVGVEAALIGAQHMQIVMKETGMSSKTLKDETLELIDAESDARDRARLKIEQMKTGVDRNYRKIQIITDNCEGPIDRTKGFLRKTVVKQCGTTATKQMLADL